MHCTTRISNNNYNISLDLHFFSFYCLLLIIKSTKAHIMLKLSRCEKCCFHFTSLQLQVLNVVDLVFGGSLLSLSVFLYVKLNRDEFTNGDKSALMRYF